MGYAKDVENFGLVPDVRGAPWWTWEDGRARMLTFNSLSQAVYMAAEKRGALDNPNVVATLDAGLTGGTSWLPHTPDDVLEFLINFHNGFHGGAGLSFVEIIRQCPKYESEWLAHAGLRGYTNRCGDGQHAYYTLCWSFLQDKFPRQLASHNQYIKGKAVAHFLQRFAWFQEKESLLGSTDQHDFLRLLAARQISRTRS